MLDFLRKKHTRIDYLRGQLGAFAHENKDVLVMVADPESDYMFVAYKDKMVLGRLKSMDGERMNVVHDVLRQSALKSKFDAAVDRLLGAMVDVLQVPLKQGNQFYSFISDVLFAFQNKSKEWSEKRKKVEEILADKPLIET